MTNQNSLKVDIEIFCFAKSLGENKPEDGGGNLMEKTVVFMKGERKCQQMLRKPGCYLKAYACLCLEVL